MMNEQIAQQISALEKRISDLERIEGSAWDKVYHAALTGSGTFDVQNIPQNYEHLWIWLHSRADLSADFNGVLLYFNNDTTAGNYYVRWDGGTIVNNSSIGFTCAATASANAYGAHWIQISRYSQAHYHPVMILESNIPLISNISGRYAVLRWNSAVAINRIALLPADGGGQFVAGSQLTIYAS